MLLKDVKAVITGGASGLGLATAKYLLEHGANVTLLDMQADRGQSAAKALGSRAFFQALDVSDELAAAKAMRQAQESMGGLNVAINCAGILGAGRVLGKSGPMALDNFATTIKVNLIGSFNIAKTAADLMQHNAPGDDGERGLIINTASVAAYEGQIGQAAYSASKGGVVGMTLPMARELGKFGIRVMTIAPGIFQTAMVAGMPDDVRASLSAQMPFPARLGEGEEYAQTVGFIVTNRYINGSVIRVDGAVRLAAK
jgi:NAD(P)-dependent dehydrogenase (short-subunit alcohol dehydrogenase family)